jgi:3-oxoacyl-[acyl-carrier-protein] synthase-3
MENKPRALRFKEGKVTGIVTVVGDKKIDFLEEYSDLGLDEDAAKRLCKVMGFGSRYVVSGTQTTSDLCCIAAKKIFNEMQILPEEIDALIFVTQTPDFGAPATAVHMQHRLGLSTTSMCFDLRLGCSGFVYGLANAHALIESGFNKVLLCVGDVASKLTPPNDHTISPIMGDAGSAILIEKQKSDSVFHMYSDGSGYDALIVPNSGIRKEPRFADHPALMKMDGAAVFNFTLKRVPGMVQALVDTSDLDQNDIDYFILHQPNKYILNNLSKKMKIDTAKLPSETQSRYGNQNSASIPGTINGFLSKPFSQNNLTSLYAGFGIGLSWAGCLLNTSRTFCPETIIMKEE